MSGKHTDAASRQLPDAAKSVHGDAIATNAVGIPMPSLTSTLTVGIKGNILLQDLNMLDHQAHFNRERIPERVVHAKGGGAFGYFEVTADITRFCKAKVFERVGKKTPILMRFSTVMNETGGSDVIRNPRGFAIKFYTDEGVWDLVGNNTPIFFIRDPILFPSFVHSQKRNPVTYFFDANMAWDFFGLRPESVHQNMITYSDRGIPFGFRHMHGFGSHTYKMVNSKLEAVYVKFHMRTDQGIKNLTPEEATKIQETEMDHSIRDLYNAIADGNYPSWIFHIQVMTFEQAEKFRWNPFDLTKIWPRDEFPLIRCGKLVLNKNPTSYFAQIEQAAFAPSHMVPGIEPSPDKMLHGRMFSYVDTHRHRVGPNVEELPVNSPRSPLHTYDRDGPMYIGRRIIGPNYYPNIFGGPEIDPKAKQSTFYLSGDVKRYNSDNEDNFSQPAIFWEKCFDDAGRQQLVNNLANDLQYAIRRIQRTNVRNFAQVNADFGRMLQKALDERRRPLAHDHLDSYAHSDSDRGSDSDSDRGSDSDRESH